MIEPTIYGLSNKAYHFESPYTDYLSSSQLKFYSKSPRYARFMLDSAAAEESDALRFGSLFHDLMAALSDGATLDEVIAAVAVFEPPVNEKTSLPYGDTTKAFAAAYDAFMQANSGKLIASRDELSQVSAMLHSLLNGSGATSAQVRKLLRWGKAEVSYFYETEDGTKLKVRPDLLSRGDLVDWKTCALDSLDEDSIARQIIKYRYDISLSMYQWVLHEINKKWYRPLLIFVQKQPPYDAIICDISEWCFSRDEYDLVTMGCGALEFKRLLNLHTACVKSNSWPGAESAVKAENNARIMKPSVPVWFDQKYFKE